MFMLALANNHNRLSSFNFESMSAATWEFAAFVGCLSPGITHDFHPLGGLSPVSIRLRSIESRIKSTVLRIAPILIPVYHDELCT